MCVLECVLTIDFEVFKFVDESLVLSLILVGFINR